MLGMIWLVVFPVLSKNMKSNQSLYRALAGLNMSMPNGGMEVIQIDGGNEIATAPATESIGILYPGERIDIITSNHQVTTLSVTLDPE